jgi:P63C domain
MVDDEKVEGAAKTLSELGAAKGGEARAKKLSPEKRKEIARAAVQARWAKAGKQPPPVADYIGDLKIGDAVLPCAVLQDGTRVLNQAGFLRAIGRARSPKAGTGVLSTVDELPFFLQAKRLKPFISKELMESTKPIFYETRTGKAVGYNAQLLPLVCEAYLRFRDHATKTSAGLPVRYEKMVAAADMLMRGLAHVGIVSLVDEATGYQEVRAKNALAEILEAFIAKELRKWVSTFPMDYYKELFRLRGWRFPDLPEDQRKRPILVGKLTNDVVYDRLAPGIREELQRLTPRDDKGRLKHKLFQRLTEDTGHPKLREHLASVVALMKASDNWQQFMRMINRSLPKYGTTRLLEFKNSSEV